MVVPLFLMTVSAFESFLYLLYDTKGHKRDTVRYYFILFYSSIQFYFAFGSRIQALVPFPGLASISRVPLHINLRRVLTFSIPI